jgi:hypothetical protein
MCHRGRVRCARGQCAQLRLAREQSRLPLRTEAVAQTTHRSGASICDGRPMLRAAEYGRQVGRERRQSDESRSVSHQLGSKPFRAPLCNSLDDEQERSARLLLLTKGAVYRSSLDGSLTCELDEKRQSGRRAAGSNRRKVPYVGCQPEASRSAVVAAADAAHRSRYRHACVARLSRSGKKQQSWAHAGRRKTAQQRNGAGLLPRSAGAPAVIIG